MQQPSSGTGGTALVDQPAVGIADAAGNVVVGTPPTDITIAIGNNAGPGTLTCTTNPVTTVNGVAQFAGCKIDVKGANYTLTASGGSFPTITSDTFDIQVGPRYALKFADPPVNQPAGVQSGPLSLWVVDRGGNLVTAGAAASRST